MKTPAVSTLSSRYGAATAAVLLCLGAVACFRGYDPAKIKCEESSQCPSNYTCVRPSPPAPGTCTRSGTEPKDGAVDVTLDGVRDLASGGAGGRIDGPLGGAGGVGGGRGGTTGNLDTPGTGGGSGGASDVPGTGGGSGGNFDAPLGTGGAPPADAGLVIGSPCTGDDQCPSKLCVDGVCCDKACTGCNACSAARTGGVDGTCAPVAAGTDPHDFCADETTATPAKPCGNDGTCDGKGACRKVGSGQDCGAASCSTDGSTFTPASKCDGNGTCAAGTPQVCTPYECATTGCKKTCTTTAQCDTGTYCDTAAGVCVTKKTNGKPASQPVECASGIVADGVCCDKECTGCNACTAALNGQAASTTGTCMAVTAAKAADPHGVCPASSDPCGMDGTCNGAGACHYAALGADCGTPSCAAATATLTKSACSANHTCVAGPATACPGLMACASASACRTGTCASDSDCATGNFCLSGTCTPKYDNGHSCTSGANNQCGSGNCVGTTCCSTACGECHTCANATGTCTTVSNGTACGTGVCNNGTCSACNAGVACTVAGDECWNHATSCSTGTSQCVPTTQVNNGTLCGASATCSGNQSIGHWTCQGGTCTQPTPTPCPYTCNTSTGACAGECTPGTSQCVSSTQIRTCSTSYTYGAATSCGVNKSCTGDQCVCNAGTCGTTCITCTGGRTCQNGSCACPSGTSDCGLGGTCYSIATDPTHCGASCLNCGTGSSCSGGTCVCRTKSSGNLLTNPGFNTASELSFNWNATTGVSWSSDEPDGCPNSGSALVNADGGSISQCIPATPGVRYYFGVRYKSSDSASWASCYYNFTTDFMCNNTTFITARFAGGASTTWAPTGANDVAPADAAGIEIQCTAYSKQVLYDQFYVNAGTETGF